MTTTWKIERQVHFRHAGHGRGKQAHQGPAAAEPKLPKGRVPRVSKLMALALHLDELRQSGAIASYAEVARLGHVTQARGCQIMNLVYLAPDLQEAILFLPNWPGPTLRNREAAPLVVVSRVRAAYKVAAGVLPFGLDQ